MKENWPLLTADYKIQLYLSVNMCRFDHLEKKTIYKETFSIIIPTNYDRLMNVVSFVKIRSVIYLNITKKYGLNTISCLS